MPFQTGERGATPSSNDSGLNFIMKNAFSTEISSELSMSVGKAGGHGQELGKQMNGLVF